METKIKDYDGKIMKFSVITIASKNRVKQVENLLSSISYSISIPFEVILVWIGESTTIKKPYNLKVIEHVVDNKEGKMLYAGPRNKGFELSSSDRVIFLDADCICSPTLFDSLLLDVNDSTIISGKPRFLTMVPTHANYGQLTSQAVKHPKRELVPVDTNVSHNYFWSMVFAITRNAFNGIGRFDEDFKGYGGEDSDFAERFSKKNYNLKFVDDFVLHQYHDKFDPPLHQIESICLNANLFYKKHGEHTMLKWISVFEDMGYVRLEGTNYTVVRLPDIKTIEEHRSTKPF